MQFLYPKLSAFVSKFKMSVESTDPSIFKLYIHFRKDVKEINSDNAQILRAKVVAT